jgi:hypothetical protein
MHTLTVMGGISPDKPVYGLAYLNQQSPVGLTLAATNQYLDYDELDAPSGWEQLYLATTADVFSAGIEIPFPTPANTAVILGARATLYYWEYRLVGPG